jgi:hypothetical protein
MLEDMIKMLDVPSSQGRGNEMATINLGRITSQEAQSLVSKLFEAEPKEQRPTIIPLADVNKLTIIGSALALTQAIGLLNEVDGGGDDPVNFSHTVAVVTLESAAPNAVQGALRALLTPRQSRLIKMLASPDGKSLSLAGPTEDVGAVRAWSKH